MAQTLISLDKYKPKAPAKSVKPTGTNGKPLFPILDVLPFHTTKNL